MTSYRIEQSNDLGDLEVTITSLLARGWRLQGGLAVTTYEGETQVHLVFAQALIIDRLSDE